MKYLLVVKVLFVGRLSRMMKQAETSQNKKKNPYGRGSSLDNLLLSSKHIMKIVGHIL